MENDLILFRRFCAGEEAAFDCLVEKYRLPLTRFVNRYVADEAVAEEIAIDAFFSLTVHRHHFRAESAVKTYLFTIGRNRAVDFLRHEYHYGKAALENVPPQTANTGDPTFEVAYANERERTLHKAINALPPDMQAAIALCYFEGQSYAQAAKIMKKSTKQLDNLLTRAKKKLREALGEEAAF